MFFHSFVLFGGILLCKTAPKPRLKCWLVFLSAGRQWYALWRKYVCQIRSFRQELDCCCPCAQCWWGNKILHVRRLQAETHVKQGSVWVGWGKGKQRPTGQNTFPWAVLPCSPVQGLWQLAVENTAEDAHTRLCMGQKGILPMRLKRAQFIWVNIEESTWDNVRG